MSNAASRFLSFVLFFLTLFLCDFFSHRSIVVFFFFVFSLRRSSLFCILSSSTLFSNCKQSDSEQDEIHIYTRTQHTQHKTRTFAEWCVYVRTQRPSVISQRRTVPSALALASRLRCARFHARPRTSALCPIRCKGNPSRALCEFKTLASCISNVKANANQCYVS